MEISDKSKINKELQYKKIKLMKNNNNTIMKKSI